MKRYIVGRKLTRIQYFEVEAESAPDALVLVSRDDNALVPRHEMQLLTEYYVVPDEPDEWDG